MAFFVLAPLPVVALDFEYNYDALNRLIRVVDSDDNVITYNYDEVGNILSIERTTVGNLPQPTLTNATPNQFNQADLATLVLTGTSLLGGVVTTTHPGMTIDGVFGDDTQITANLTVDISAPLGPAPLTVTTVSGADSLNVTILGARPLITSITPNFGPSTGGTPVTVTGLRFTSDTILTIGGNAATNIVIVNSTTLTALTPVGIAGQPPVSVDVEVSNANGSDILPDGFTYVFGLNYGDIVSATIDPVGDEDRYAFNGVAGDQLLIRLKPTSSAVASVEATMQVFREDGSVLCAGTNSGANISLLLELTAGCVLDSSGAHSILVSDTGSDESGDYDLLLQRLNPIANPTPLVFGHFVSGTITPSLEMDAYSFTGTAGDVVRVRMGDGRLDSGSTSIDNQLQVFDPAGVALGSVVQELDTVVDVTLPATGTYLILASDAGGDQTAPYGLSLQRLNNPGNVTPLSFGETVTGSISALAELDSYSFTGTAGDVVRVRMGDGRLDSGSTSIDNQLQVFDPAGVVLGSVVQELDAVVDVTLPATGTYLILASDAGGDQTAPYGLSLQRLNNPGNATTLSFGETVTGSISALAELDSYSFTGTAGDVVRVRMGDGSPAPDSIDNQLQVFDPTGVALGNVTSEVDAVVDVTLPATGTYLVLASDAGGNQTATYGLSLQRLNNPGNATPIAFGETVSGNIDSIVELDAYVFNGNLGDEVQITMTRTSGSLDPQIQTYRPDGSNITDCSNFTTGAVLVVSCILDVSGDHAILLSDAGGNETGNYDLTLSSP